MLSIEQINFLKSLWESSVGIGHHKAIWSGEASLQDFMEPEPYEGQDKIVSYLRHAGFIYVVSMSGGSRKCDGEFSWSSKLADIVEKNNLRLEPEFERAVLDDPKRMTRLRKALLERGIHTWDL